MASTEFKELESLFPPDAAVSARQNPFAEIVAGPEGTVDPRTVLRPHDPKQTNMMSLQSAMTSAANDGKPLAFETIVDKFMQYKSLANNDPNYEGLKRTIVDMRAAKDTEALHGLFEGYINNLQFDKAEQLIKGMSGYKEQIQYDTQGKSAYPRAVVETLGKNMDDLVREELVAQQTLAQITSEMFEDEGLWTKIGEFSGFLIPDMTKDMSDAMDTSLIDAPKAVGRFVEIWDSLLPEEKEQLAPILKDHLLKAMDGNKRKVAAFMNRLMTPAGGQTVRTDSLMEGWNTALIVAPLMGVMRNMYKAALNSPKFLKSANQPKVAGDLSAHVLRDQTGELSRVANVERTSAVTNATPTKAEKFDPSQYTDNIHAETMQALRQQEERLAEITRNDAILKADPLRAAEIAKVKDKYLAKYRTYEGEPSNGFQNVEIIEETPSGFALDVTFGASKTAQPFKSIKGAEKKLKELTETGIVRNGKIEKLEDGSFVIKDKATVHYTLSDVGEYMGDTTVGPIGAYGTTPSWYMAALETPVDQIASRSAAVEAATRAELGKAVYADTLTKMVQESVKPLGKISVNPAARKRLGRVNEVLLQGDGHTELMPDGSMVRGKTYTPSELKYGIDTPKGRIQLNDDEISAYYGLRRVADWMFAVKNQNVRSTLQLRGIKSIDVEGKSVLGKPYENADAARAAVGGRNIQIMFNPEANNGLGATVARQSIDFSEMYSKNYRLVHLDEPVKLGEQKVRWAWVRDQHVSDLPDQVLNYKHGYVPKIYKDAYYFVKQEVRDTLDGVPNQIVGQRTLRIFGAEKRQAEEFLLKEQDTARLLKETLDGKSDDAIMAARKSLEDMGYDGEEINRMLEAGLKGERSLDPNSFKLLSDREMSAEQLIRESHGVSGGLFTAPRATHDILYGVNGEVPKRYSAFESYQRYIQHISNYLPRNEWRLAEQQRWLNTAHKLKAVDPNITDFREAVKSIQLKEGSKEQATLAQAGRWILDQARIPTKEEEVYAQLTRSLVEWMESPLEFGPVTVASAKAPLGARNWVMSLAQKDPFSAGRAAAFHALLGWFNPAQLFVQAQGASIAMTLHPTSAAFSLRRAFYLNATAWSPNEGYVRNAAKAMLMDGDEAVAMWKLFNKTGLKESIRATADHAASAQGYGITMNAIKDVADKGLWFYRQGEMFNRSYSFSTAVHQWMAKTGKGIKDIADADLKEILDETMHISLNMTAANRAQWQKGAMSLPTQFMQIQAKWIEAMMPMLWGSKVQKFTPAQTRRMLLGQVLLYGAAGVPLGNTSYNAWQYYMGDQNPGAENMDPATMKYINGGIWDLAAYTAFGANVELGGRGAIASGLVETMFDMVLNEHDLSGFLGAFGQTGSTLLEGIGKLKPLVANANKIDWSEKEAMFIANELGQTVATWRNASKAYVMYRTGLVMDRNGRPLIDKQGPGGFRMADIMFQAMGFQQSEQKALSNLKAMNKAIDQARADIVSSIVNIHYDYLGGLAGEIKNPKSAQNVQVMMDYYRAIVGDDVEWRKVQKAVAERITQGDDERSIQIRKWYKNYSTALVDKAGGAMASTGLGPYTNQLLSGQFKANDPGEK